jgi:hypothetical protein
MQMMKGVCSTKRVGNVRRLLSFSVAKRTLAVWICASSLMASLYSGGGGGTHLDSVSMEKYFRLDNWRWTSTIYLFLSDTGFLATAKTCAYACITMFALNSSSSTVPSARSNLLLEAGKREHQAVIAVSRLFAATFVVSMSPTRRVASARFILSVRPTSCANDENSLSENSRIL